MTCGEKQQQPEQATTDNDARRLREPCPHSDLTPLLPHPTDRRRSFSSVVFAFLSLSHLLPANTNRPPGALKSFQSVDRLTAVVRCRSQFLQLGAHE